MSTDLPVQEIAQRIRNHVYRSLFQLHQVTGSLDRSLDSLRALYVAGVCGLGYGLRQILDAEVASGSAV